MAVGAVYASGEPRDLDVATIDRASQDWPPVLRVAPPRVAAIGFWLAMDARLVTTLGLVLDIAGAMMLAAELFARRLKTRREILVDQLANATLEHLDAQRQVEHLREQGFSHSEPQILLS